MVPTVSGQRTIAFVLALITSGCPGKKNPGPADATPSTSLSALAPVPDRAARIHALLLAEHRRWTPDVADADLTSRDVVVRRHAARALARIADDEAAKRLLRPLADEDAEVVAWSAYGLGYACKGRESSNVRALVGRAATLAAESTPPKTSLLDPMEAIADALGRCATPESEATLRAWLESEPRETSAALALGRMASRRKRLDDSSLVALLDAASRPERPLGAALFAFTRLSKLGESVEKRLFEVASEALSDKPGPRRSFAIRALGRAGVAGSERLAALVVDKKLSPSERSDAARELTKPESNAQKLVKDAFVKLAPDTAKLDGPDWGPIITLIGGLQSPLGDAVPVLERLSQLEVPKQKSLARRTITLRCRAAAALANGMLSPKLESCDPDPNGPIGRLALLEVVSRAKITGTRHRRWKELSESKNPVVRQAAIEKMMTHPEIERPYEALARALRAPDGGTVAQAAQVLAAFPNRASESPPDDDKKAAIVKPNKEVVDALTTAFTVQRPPDAVEVWSALMGAVGALQLLSFKPKLETWCKSDNPTLRRDAEKTLKLLSSQKASCKAKGPGKDPPELATIPRTTTLVFVTDAGEVKLRLDTELAPVAAERLIELAKSGFFDGVVIHRVVPGFVVQLGDKGGDGYGGAGKEPLRCETSPISFVENSVGIALAGRDTGASQLFVTLGPYPHLDGDYALVGKAEPGWEKIAQGDVVRKVRVLAPP
jgi:cyclophilin family peptidyl-prolyl cis-trans isomerase